MTGAVREFLLPDLGEGLEDATITEWSVAVGDQVELNQTLCTVETNKAQVELPSPFAGRIAELGGEQGDTLAVGAVLVRIATAEAASDARPLEPKRRPVLVGYGADDDLDVSRRPVSRRPRAAPRTRKLAADLDVDLEHVGGSGKAAVITRDDVLAAAGGREALADADTIAVSGVQATMAERMTMSRTQIPDAHARVEVDCSALLRVRDLMRGGADEAAPVTPFVLVLRLLVVALRRHSRLNSTWVNDAEGPRIHLHPAVHLGFGVATERGLLVPVVRDADAMSTRELVEWVTRLVTDARSGTVKPVDLQGSTFTVSNFGALGLDDGVPVINFPEAAIVGLGSIKPRPLVVEGAVLARPTMAMTCAFDHRVIDGAQAAAFLCEVRDLIEAPELALLDL